MSKELNKEDSPLQETIDELSEAAQSITVTPKVAVRRTRRLEVILFLAIAVFFVTAVSAHFDNYFSWDLLISHSIQSINLPGFQKFMILISFPGNHVTIAIAMVSIAFGALLLLNYKLEANLLLLSAGGGELFNIFVKWIVGRPRPISPLVNILVHETTFSFPSGHVMHYVTFYGFIFFFAFSKLKNAPVRILLLFLSGLLVLSIGFSRVYLGAHWPSDVAAAYLGGTVWLTFVIDRYRRQQLH